MNNNDVETLKTIASPIAEKYGLFLVDVEIKHEKVPVVWILVDSEEGGVNLDSCTKISRELGDQLEEESGFIGTYRLNVSSPGLSRPLSDKRQYNKNRGRNAKVKFKEGDNYETAEGTIEKADQHQIVINKSDGKAIEIPFSSIVETKIIPKI